MSQASRECLQTIKGVHQQLRSRTKCRVSSKACSQASFGVVHYSQSGSCSSKLPSNGDCSISRHASSRVGEVFLLKPELLLQAQKKHVFADLVKRPPSNSVFCRAAKPGVSQRCEKNILCRQRQQTALKKSNKARAATQCRFRVLFPRQTSRPSRYDSATSRLSLYDNQFPTQLLESRRLGVNSSHCTSSL